MADIKHIIITITGSVILVGAIGMWVGYSSGELSLSPNSDTFNDQLPGPLSPPENITQASNTPNTMDEQKKANPTATFHTSKGDIVLELYQDAMPITVGNFVKLAKEGFYNNTKFHRVIDGFMIQGGDPNSKGSNPAVYGQGGPGYTIEDEFVADPRLTNVKGTIAMANTGQPNSGGSQFFINTGNNVGLDYDKEPAASKHPVFGRVIQGIDIVDTIGKVETGARDVPVVPVIISGIEILEK